MSKLSPTMRLSAVCLPVLMAPVSAQFYVSENYYNADCSDAGPVIAYPMAMIFRCEAEGANFRMITCDSAAGLLVSTVYTDAECTTALAGQDPYTVPKTCEAFGQDANGTDAAWRKQYCAAESPLPAGTSLKYQKYSDAACTTKAGDEAEFTAELGCSEVTHWDGQKWKIESVHTTLAGRYQQMEYTTKDCSGAGEEKSDIPCNTCHPTEDDGGAVIITGTCTAVASSATSHVPFYSTISLAAVAASSLAV